MSKASTPEEMKEDYQDFQMKTAIDAMRAGFESWLSADTAEPMTGFMLAAWSYHMRARELVMDECCRIIRRASQSMQDEGSNLDNDTIETLSTAFIAAIQKQRTTKHKAGS